MKFLAVFAAILAVSAAHAPIATWTLDEVTAALADPSTDPAAVPYLVDGLNQIMANLHAGEQQTAVVISVPTQSSMTLEELTAAVHDPSTNPALLPYYEGALMDLMVAMNNGQEEYSIVLNIPAMSVNVWTLDQLSAALVNPETDPELHIYLEHAINELMDQIYAGNQVTEIAVVTPPGVIATVPVTPEVVIPEPVVVAPVAPEPVIVAPVAPEPVIVVEGPQITPEPVIVAPVVPEVVAPEPAVVPEAPAAASSPLVQIIVNVNAQPQVAAPAPVVAPQPAVEAEPIITEIISPMPVVDGIQGVISPVPVVDSIHEIISPMPVVDGIQGIISPMPVVDGIQGIISPMPVVDGAQGIISPMPVVDGAQGIISPMPVVEGAVNPIGQTPIIAVGPWA